MTESVDAGRVRELLRRGAEQVLATGPLLLEQIDAAALGEHDAAVASDPTLVAAFRRANGALIAHWARSVTVDPSGAVPAFDGPEALALVRDLVRRGYDGQALEPYRAGQNAAWRLWMEIAFTLTTDALELQHLLRVSAQSIFDYVDATNVITMEQIAQERAQLTRGTQAERLELVTLLLDDAPVQIDQASRRLGYDLQRTHLAAIVWTHQTFATPADYEPLALALAAAAGGGRPLIVVASAAAVWVWVTSTATDPDLDALAQMLGDAQDVRIALGPAAAGVDGFRRSHRDAFVTQRLVTRLASSARLVRYQEVKVLALLTQEQHRLDAFVTETLGGLATAGGTLQDTVRTYLRLHSSATRAARDLFTHRNTVVARLARAEELLPHGLDGTALDVALALEIVRWTGSPAAASPA